MYIELMHLPVCGLNRESITVSLSFLACAIRLLFCLHTCFSACLLGQFYICKYVSDLLSIILLLMFRLSLALSFIIYIVPLQLWLMKAIFWDVSHKMFFNKLFAVCSLSMLELWGVELCCQYSGTSSFHLSVPYSCHDALAMSVDQLLWNWAI